MRVISNRLSVRASVLALAVLFAVGLSSFTLAPKTTTSNAGWEHLGSRKVNFGLEKDVISVTAAEGRFSKLKLKVTGGNLNLHKMTVTYGNGTRDNINVRHSFARGATSRVIDLQGNKRVIKQVAFWYDTKNRSQKRARIHLFGRH
jgi:hypothetical protein